MWDLTDSQLMIFNLMFMINFLRGLDNSKEVPVDCSAVQMLVAHSYDKLNANISSRENASPLTIKSFTDCHHLLNLLTLMSDVNTESFSHIASCIFNLESYIHLCAG